ncbi:monovalent cation/H+ antiporter complex subunit F [Myceligenerans xiligouense]|uniref:Multisubunit sodium/proton antiporter MrpF subunit n=1 Tax=Myceligenerans xiligouense TaxID=253184 RepID=A0A3N4YQU7_9MICO|nr:monovalent cation/H+ antiporter complex subunit F [Myceligenerans xiligouense]RPF23409.1 multisubunit sodium/proton antiporter MrpF subunit [Myceligenerans xiligouense]
MMVAVGVGATVLLAVGAVLAVVRMERGPSMLDRTIAFDVVTTALVGAVAVEAALSRRVESVPILVVLSMVGFIGSVTIARFAAEEPPRSHASGQGTDSSADPADKAPDRGNSSRKGEP